MAEVQSAVERYIKGGGFTVKKNCTYAEGVHAGKKGAVEENDSETSKPESARVGGGGCNQRNKKSSLAIVKKQQD